jgi:hypothetical protein
VAANRGYAVIDSVADAAGPGRVLALAAAYTTLSSAVVLALPAIRAVCWQDSRPPIDADPPKLAPLNDADPAGQRSQATPSRRTVTRHAPEPIRKPHRPHNTRRAPRACTRSRCPPGRPMIVTDTP